MISYYIPAPKFVVRWLYARAMKMHARKPIDWIYDDDGSLYMERYLLVSWHNPTGIGARLHITRRSDRDKDHHDHPWWNISWVLDGGYYEEYVHETPLFPGAPDKVKTKYRRPGSLVFRTAQDSHRLDLRPDTSKMFGVAEDMGVYRELPSMSLFITGPWAQDWGFWRDGVKVFWKDYLEHRKAEVAAGRKLPLPAARPAAPRREPRTGT